MRILFLAPQPFFEERGTPIAVDLVLKSLSERCEEVDVVTYHLGQDVHYKGVNLHRIANVPFIRQVSPGFSSKKALLDVVMLFKVLGMAFRGRYQLVHAVEESVFIALLLKILLGIPYVYDMDSSLSQQMLERHPILFRPFYFLLAFMERLAIRNAKAVLPVCDALVTDIEKYKPEKVVLLRDVSLLKPNEGPLPEDLRAELGIEGPLGMYVGNLEPYQGIDLLLEGFAMALKPKNLASLVIIGGKETDIEKYRQLAQRLGIQKQVHFLGPRPMSYLAAYLAQADFLVSPRVKGKNTPMKIYSYLDSGKALLATNLPTHTQVLNDDVAMLAAPSPRDFSRGVLRLAEDLALRQKLGKAGKQLIAERHTYEAFRLSLDTLYDWLRAEITHEEAAHPIAKDTITGPLHR